MMPARWTAHLVLVYEVAATKGTGIDQLLEMMALQAEVMELKASPTARPRGTVIEAQVEAGRGPTATIIVQMGTLKGGEPFISGPSSDLFPSRQMALESLFVERNVVGKGQPDTLQCFCRIGDFGDKLVSCGLAGDRVLKLKPELKFR